MSFSRVKGGPENFKKISDFENVAKELLLLHLRMSIWIFSTSFLKSLVLKRDIMKRIP